MKAALASYGLSLPAPAIVDQSPPGALGYDKLSHAATAIALAPPDSAPAALSIDRPLLQQGHGIAGAMSLTYRASACVLQTAALGFEPWHVPRDAGARLAKFCADYAMVAVDGEGRCRRAGEGVEAGFWHSCSLTM